MMDAQTWAEAVLFTVTTGEKSAFPDRPPADVRKLWEKCMDVVLAGNEGSACGHHEIIEKAVADLPDEAMDWLPGLI